MVLGSTLDGLLHDTMPSGNTGNDIRTYEVRKLKSCEPWQLRNGISDDVNFEIRNSKCEILLSDINDNNGSNAINDINGHNEFSEF